MSTNLYSLFKKLLPSSPLQVGTISSFSNGVATVTLPGGGTTQARGADVSVGQKVFIRDGVIEGAAPNLPTEIIEV